MAVPAVSDPLDWHEVSRAVSDGYFPQKLLRAADGFTVADVAMSWGLMHTGRFAAAYRRKYGESPSETLLGYRAIPH